jgi:hypothetical protein
MRSRFPVFAILPLIFGLAVSPAHANPIITFTLDSNIGYGAPAGNPDPDTCLPSNCVLFTGTLTDFGDPATDITGVYYSYDAVSFPYTADAPAFANVLTLDTYLSPPGLMSGDPNSAMDGNPQNVYTGPIFEVDIPEGTPSGIYTDIVDIDFTNLDTGATTTVSQIATVVVVPEPLPIRLSFAGLLAFAVWRGVRRKWRSSEASL